MNITYSSRGCRRFDGQIAIVTGAAQGIGKATAVLLASEGATVLVADRANREAKEVVDLINGMGGQSSQVIADMETWNGAESVVKTAIERYGRVDVAVHNVGGTIWSKPYHLYPIEQIEKEIQRSLWPTLWGCRAVAPIMVQQKYGVIVNVGSVATRGINRIPYSAAKGGVTAITICMAMELAKYNIRVNCVAPGGIDIDRKIARNLDLDSYDQIDAQGLSEAKEQTSRDTPMGRRGQPQEVAAAVVYMASSDASYITGEVLHCSGGGTGLK